MAETVKVSQWGNSVAVRIPRSIARKFNIYAGKRLRVTYLDGNIILKVEPTEQELVDEWLTYIDVYGIHPDE